eukprot:jgi/Botrbrau1/16160/Bobra.0309s0009.1
MFKMFLTNAGKPFKSLAAIMNYSPFEFASPGLEQGFQMQHQMHLVSITTYQIGMTLIFIAILGLKLFQLRDSEEALAVAACIGASAVVVITAGVIRVTDPKCFEKHRQIFASLLRVFVALHAIATRRLFKEDRREDPFSFMVFVRVYVHNGLVGAMLLMTQGCPLPLVPNVLTALAMLAMIVSDNPWYCAKIVESAAGRRDMSLLGSLTSQMALWTDAMSSAGQHMYIKPVPQAFPCTSNMATLQVAIMAISVSASLLGEVSARRKFLMKSHMLLGPGGAARAAKWPIGSLKGITVCLSTFLGVVWGFSLAFQTVLLVCQFRQRRSCDAPGCLVPDRGLRDEARDSFGNILCRPEREN